MNRQTAEQVLETVQSILTERFPSMGVLLTSRKLSSTSVSARLELCETTEDGTALGREAQDFLLYGPMRGFKAEDLGAVFTTPGGKTWKIIGWLPRSTRTPLLCEQAGTGKQFKLPVETSLRALLAQKETTPA